MSYNFEQCFWDQNDQGVFVLLTHIASGIRSCNTVINFFKQKSELEKDFSRRLGAINDRLVKDMEKNPEFGNLNDSIINLLNIERSRGQSHSKQSEIIYRQLYTDTKAFSGELQAKYTTLSGKIEKLKLDKYNKKKGCEELNKRLEEAEIRTRSLKLNQDNIIGHRQAEQNQRELAKWNSNVQESQNQFRVLKQEYKASQKFWLSEWTDLTHQFQEMESSRISFIQSKLQQYSDAMMETCILEQSKMELLTNHLAMFTASDDISRFSSKFGTGRLREKTPKTKDISSNSANPSSKYLTSSLTSRTKTIMSNNSNMSFSSGNKRNSYVENIRKLSSQLQQSTSANKNSLSKMEDRTNKPLPEILKNVKKEITRPSNTPSKVSSQTDDDDVQIIRIIPALKSKRVISSHKVNNQKEEYSSSESSNPTDFTHIRNKSSIDTLATSVSSYTNSIDDSQRFAKSWNSSNRRRKSTNNLQLPSPSSSDHEHEEVTGNDPHMRTSSINTTVINSEMSLNRTSKGNARRKSMVLENSKNPIEDALYEMSRIQSIGTNGFANPNPDVGRFRDNAITVTLPLVTKNGEAVIKYAKAVHPLLDNDAPGLAHFEKNDYLLITELVNPEWYKGEVYGNDMIGVSHREGLIPFNFIELLS